jgi:hypothetical protein
MFQLLNKARREMSSEGSFSRYLRYALGEIVLVVIGILIALQIDNWNDRRIDSEKEREYLSSMLTDLRDDVREIDEAVSGNNILLEGIDDLLGMLAEPAPDSAYRREVLISSVVRTYWHLRVDFPELTLTQLKYSGDLQLIENQNIKQAILGYEQGIEVCRHQYVELTHYFHVFEATQKQLLNLALAKKAYEYIESDWLRILGPLEPFEPLVQQGEYFVTDDPGLLALYYGDLLFYRTSLNNAVWFLGQQRQMAKQLMQLISSEYGIEG